MIIEMKEFEGIGFELNKGKIGLTLTLIGTMFTVEYIRCLLTLTQDFSNIKF